jgi:hypothetical protein
MLGKVYSCSVFDNIIGESMTKYNKKNDSNTSETYSRETTAIMPSAWWSAVQMERNPKQHQF